MSTSDANDNLGIRDAAARLSRLTQAGQDLPTFYQHFLDLLPLPPHSLGSAAWLKQGNAYRSIARGTRNPPQGIALPYSNEQHADLLGKVANQGEWEILAPRPPAESASVATPLDSPASSATTPDGPSPSLANRGVALAIFPVIRSGDTAFLLELFLSPLLSDQELHRFAVRVDVLCGIAAAYHQQAAQAPAQPQVDTHSVRATSSSPVGMSDFAREVHRSLDPTETCFAIANEGRMVVGCDRLIVLVRQGSQFHVRAVSAQDEVNPRANLIQQLQQLVARTMAVGEAFWYPQANPQLPPEIEQALEGYIEISLCRVLGVFPLFAATARWPAREGAHDPGTSKTEASVVGAIVLEWFADTDVDMSHVRELGSGIAVQSGLALGNALQQEGIFLLPIWKRLGALRSFLFSTHRAKSISGLVLLAMMCAAMIAIPAELKIGSEGSLQPVLRRNIYAQWDGTIVKLHVRHGDQVDAAEPLVEMRSEPIELGIRRLQGEILTNQSRLEAIRAQRTGAQAASERESVTRDDAAVEQQDLERLLQSLKDQLAIETERQRQLNVVSPIDGQVMTWDLEELLQDRPVRRGEMLLEIADLSGPWRLELNVPDRRTMHVLRAAEGAAIPLHVTFILASDPEHRYTGQVTEITPATSLDPDVGQYVRVHVGIDSQQVPFLQPGTKIQAKIHCGKRRLGYVWFHQVWEFLQSRVLFRVT